MTAIGILAGGCELRGEKQDKRLHGQKAVKATAGTTTKQPEATKQPEPPKPNTRPAQPQPRPTRTVTSVKPEDIKWAPYTIESTGVSFDSFGANTVREIKRNPPFVATSLAPLNAFIFYSGKTTYDTEMKRYEKRPRMQLSKEVKLQVCGKDARRREVNNAQLTTVFTGFEHKGTSMLAVWRVPSSLRAQYAAAEARFHNSIKCKQ